MKEFKKDHRLGMEVQTFHDGFEATINNEIITNGMEFTRQWLCRSFIVGVNKGIAHLVAYCNILEDEDGAGDRIEFECDLSRNNKGEVVVLDIYNNTSTESPMSLEQAALLDGATWDQVY